MLIPGGNRALTVAANSQEEKDRWKEDLQNAIQLARDKTDAKITYLSLKSCSKLKCHLGYLRSCYRVSCEVGTEVKQQLHVVAMLNRYSRWLNH